MNNNINYNVKQTIKKATIDYGRLMAKSAGPSDIARCVRLLQDNGYRLPLYCDMIDTLHVEPSTLAVPAAMQIVQTYVNKDTSHQHQIHTMDNLLDKSDLTVTDEGVSAGPGEVYGSKLGMLTKDANITLFAGATSTLINYLTSETDKGEIRDITAGVKYLPLLQIPKISLDHVREVIRTYVPSPTASQSKMYELFVKDQTNFIMVLDQVYSKCQGFSQISTVLADRARSKLKQNYDYDPIGYVPSSVDPQVKVDKSISYNQMWGLCVLSSNFRGEGNSGRGSLTCGYYNYDQPSVYVKAIARAREIISLLRLVGLKSVRIPSDKSIPPFTATILVRNGYSVIGDGGRGVFTVGSVPGYYQTSLLTTLFIYSNSVSTPIMKKVTGLTYDPTTENCLNVLGTSNTISAMFTHYTPALEEYVNRKNFSLFPSLSPHACKVWVVSQDNLYDFDHAEHKIRMTTAIIYRNLFPFTRRPFYAADAYHDIFEAEVIIPKVVRRANNPYFSLTNVLSALPSSGFIKEEVPLASYTLVDRVKPEIDLVKLTRRQLINELKGLNLNTFAIYLTDFMSKGRDVELLESVLRQESQHLAATYEILVNMAENKADVTETTLDLPLSPIVNNVQPSGNDNDGDDDYGDLDLGSVVTANTSIKL